MPKLTDPLTLPNGIIYSDTGSKMGLYEVRQSIKIKDANQNISISLCTKQQLNFGGIFSLSVGIGLLKPHVGSSWHQFRIGNVTLEVAISFSVNQSLHKFMLLPCFYFLFFSREMFTTHRMFDLIFA